MTIRKFLFETLRCAPYAARPPGRDRAAPAPVEAQKRRRKSETKTVDGGQWPWHKMRALPGGGLCCAPRLLCSL